MAAIFLALVQLPPSWGTPQSAPPETGTVRGRVGDPSIQRDWSNHVVYIEHAAGHFPPPQQHAVIDQINLRFVPHVLPVIAGTVVDFPNSDPVSHNVFSVSKTKWFNLGLYTRSKAPWVRFEKPGLVEVLCNVHLEMSAYIMVLQNPYFALTGPEGTFELANVPAGARTIFCWSERGKTEKREIRVTGGKVLAVNFGSARSSSARPLVTPAPAVQLVMKSRPAASHNVTHNYPPHSKGSFTR